MWEVVGEVVGMEVEVVGTEMVVVVEEWMEDRGYSPKGPEVSLPHSDFRLNLPRIAAALEELACDSAEGSLHQCG